MTIAESEKALLKADLEADMKYKQLIMEAESLLESLKNSLQRWDPLQSSPAFSNLLFLFVAFHATHPWPVHVASIRWPISVWRCSSTAPWSPTRSRHLHLLHRRWSMSWRRPSISASSC